MQPAPGDAICGPDLAPAASSLLRTATSPTRSTTSARCAPWLGNRGIRGAALRHDPRPVRERHSDPPAAVTPALIDERLARCSATARRPRRRTSCGPLVHGLLAPARRASGTAEPRRSRQGAPTKGSHADAIPSPSPLEPYLAAAMATRCEPPVSCSVTTTSVGAARRGTESTHTERHPDAVERRGPVRRCRSEGAPVACVRSGRAFYPVSTSTRVARKSKGRASGFPLDFPALRSGRCRFRTCDPSRVKAVLYR
jgi:hypothetical protein